jgi:hypothetical protein
MKYKYKVITALILFHLFSREIYRHSLTIAEKGGISIPNIKGNTEQSKGFTSRQGAYFGLLLNRKISNYFSLQAEVNYSPQGGQRNKMQPVPADQLSGITLPPGTQLYADFRNKTILNYIEIPVLGQLNLQQSNAFHYHINLGPYIAYLVKAQTITAGNSAIYQDPEGRMPLTLQDGTALPPVSFDNKTNIKNEIKKLNAGLVGGAGINYAFGSSKLFLEGRFTLGLTNIQTNTEENGKNHTGSVIVAIGYAYRFN